jgi:Ca-activated chloride channel family protein
MVVVYLLAGAAQAGASETPGGTLRAQEGGRVVDVPLERTEVRLRVSGFLVDAEVTQVFVNPMPKKIEALYLFPLPENAAVNELELEVGDRRVRGEIRRREEARRVYQRARRAGHVAALLEQERPNLFTQKVANLEPGARVKVRLRYVQPLAQDDGGYQLVFPMVAPPRYLPPAAARAPEPVQPQVLPPGMRSSHTIRLAVELDAGVPLGELTSPSHRVEVRAVRGDPRASVVGPCPRGHRPQQGLHPALAGGGRGARVCGAVPP